MGYGNVKEELLSEVTSNEGADGVQVNGHRSVGLGRGRGLGQGGPPDQLLSFWSMIFVCKLYILFWRGKKHIDPPASPSPLATFLLIHNIFLCAKLHFFE